MPLLDVISAALVAISLIGSLGVPAAFGHCPFGNVQPDVLARPAVIYFAWLRWKRLEQDICWAVMDTLDPSFPGAVMGGVTLWTSEGRVVDFPIHSPLWAP